MNIIKNRGIYKLNTVEKLFKWMNENVEYGYMNKNGDIILYPDMLYNYKLQSPFELYNSKVGVCWDQAVFEQYIFKNIIHKECKLYYITQDNKISGTHTFIFYKDNRKWYYFENSYQKIRGIYKIDNFKDMIQYIINNMREDYPDNAIKVYEVNKDISKFTNNFKNNTDPISFMDFCESCKLIYEK